MRAQHEKPSESMDVKPFHLSHVPAFKRAQCTCQAWEDQWIPPAMLVSRNRYQGIAPATKLASSLMAIHRLQVPSVCIVVGRIPVYMPSLTFPSFR